MGKQKLNYRFHNPNTVESTADYILKIFIEANTAKVENAIRNASEDFSKYYQVQETRSA